ncbi:MAG TPA: glycosyltransferase family 39 protein [Myxococcaceae bacterium]|nr:glycosyltransferase family 39 protein [Myxococcaceae bacterium]
MAARMEVPEKRSLVPVVSGIAAAIVGMVLFYAGSLRFGTLAHMQAYGGWKYLFSVTPRELGYHVLSHLFLLPAALFLGVALFRASRGEFSSQLSRWAATVNERRFVLALALCFIVVSLLLRLFVLHGALLTDDEETYLLQARMLLSGKLFISPPPDDAFFKHAFMTYANQRWFPLYPWGHPFFLAIGMLARAPELIPPLLGAATMALTYAIARELCGKGAALGAAVLYLLSPFAQYQAATLLSESSSTALIAASVFAYLKLARGGGQKWAAASGAALGAALNVRPLSACAAALALCVFASIALVRSRGAFLRRAWPALPCALAGVGLYLLLSRLAQGNAFAPAPFLHGATGILGFATIDPSVYSTTPELSLLVTGDYLMKLNAWLFGWPSSLVFAVAALAIPSAARQVALPLGLVTALLVAYFFCRFPSVDDVGPAYMFDAVPFLIVASVAGMSAISRVGASVGFERCRELMVMVVIAMFVVATPVFYRLQGITLSALSTTVLAPVKLVAETGIHRALVFMANRNVPRPVSWVYYPPLPKPDFSDDVLFVRDSTPEADAAFAAKYPDRNAYRLQRDWEGHWQLSALASPPTGADKLKMGRFRSAPDPASIALLPGAE